MAARLELALILRDAPIRMLQTCPMRALILTGLVLTATATAVVSANASEAQPAMTKASHWLGHSVITRDGKELGTVRDLAIDKRTGKVVYLVVSVGSFLIENNLIAIAPDALVRSGTEDGVLLFDADPNALTEATRFASDSRWPATPSVVRAERGSNEVPADTDAGEPRAAEPSPIGIATIESGSRTAHLSANERYVKEKPAPPEPAATPAPAPTTTPASATSKTRPEPITKFDRLDKDGDGVLDRAEFAHQMSRNDRYSKIDVNANGVIDPVEFDAFEEAHDEAN